MSKRSPRPHQKEAIAASVKHFKKHNKGRLIMACGTGKTLTSLWIAEALKAKKVLITVPSLNLSAQNLTQWEREYDAMEHNVGICTSFGALAHGPPGHTDEIKAQTEKNFVNQAVAEYNVYAVETAGVETESQALPGFFQLSDVAMEEFKLVSIYRESRRSSAFSVEHWRSDRSRFRW